MIANKHEVREKQKAQHINKTRGTQNKNKIRGRTEIQQYQKKVETGTQKLTHTHTRVKTRKALKSRQELKFKNPRAEGQDDNK